MLKHHFSQELSAVGDAMSSATDNAATYPEAPMDKRELSLPVMALGALAVFAIAAAVLYVGVSARRGDSPAAPQPSITADSAATASHPDTQAGMQASADSAQEWLSLAAARRRNRDYAGARDAYLQVIQRNAMTADSWADYADALASLPGGSLGGDAELAIQRALSLDPDHPKALWLEASHAYEEHRYADALIFWKRLRAALRPDSPDAGIVDANIAESAQLAGKARG
jgi:cytochrome c-type biogenesis protein CcmH